MVLEVITEFIQGVPFLDESISFLSANFLNIFLFTLGIAIYGVIVWNFYQMISKRDLFESKITSYRKNLGSGQVVFKGLLRFIEYGLLFPVVSFIWFLLLSLMLFLLAKNQTVDTILLISISVISAARIGSYYSQKLAEDIGKLLPLAVLGVFLVDQQSLLSFDLFFSRLEQSLDFMSQALAYIIYLVVLEWLMRFLLAIKVAFFGDGMKRKLEIIPEESREE